MNYPNFDNHVGADVPTLAPAATRADGEGNAAGDGQVAISGPEHYRRAGELLGEYDRLRRADAENAGYTTSRLPSPAIRNLEEQIRMHVSLAQLAHRVLTDANRPLGREPGGRIDGKRYRDLFTRWLRAVR